MIEPYYADESVTLYHGDALEVLRSLPDVSVSCCVTSPPYYGLRDYGEPGQYGLEPTPAAYVESRRRALRRNSHGRILRWVRRAPMVPVSAVGAPLRPTRRARHTPVLLRRRAHRSEGDPVTPDEMRQQATDIVLDHAKDVEFLSVVEMVGDDCPYDVDPMSPEFDALCRQIHDLCRTATVTVEWPEATADV